MKCSYPSLLGAFGLLGLLQACASIPRHADVWDNYDVRHETPTLAAPAAIDNDSYYSVPDCTIMDSPSCGDG